jgi:hypothetical protein
MCVLAPVTAQGDEDGEEKRKEAEEVHGVGWAKAKGKRGRGMG